MVLALHWVASPFKTFHAQKYKSYIMEGREVLQVTFIFGLNITTFFKHILSQAHYISRFNITSFKTAFLCVQCCTLYTFQQKDEILTKITKLFRRTPPLTLIIKKIKVFIGPRSLDRSDLWVEFVSK